MPLSGNDAEACLQVVVQEDPYFPVATSGALGRQYLRSDQQPDISTPATFAGPSAQPIENNNFLNYLQPNHDFNHSFLQFPPQFHTQSDWPSSFPQSAAVAHNHNHQFAQQPGEALHGVYYNNIPVVCLISFLILLPV